MKRYLLKRYLLFSWDNCYPEGGFNDLDGDFDTIEECKQRYLQHRNPYGREGEFALFSDRAGHIYDRELNRIILYTYCRYETKEYGWTSEFHERW